MPNPWLIMSYGAFQILPALRRNKAEYTILIY